MKNKFQQFQELSDEALEKVTGGVGDTISICVSVSESSGNCPDGYERKDSETCCPDGPMPQTREHILL